MQNNDLLDMIWQYCKEEKLTKTMKALSRKKNDADPSLIRMFERHFAKNGPKELSFTFKLNSKRSNLRKRISQMESEKEKSSPSRKKVKVDVNHEQKRKVEPVPEYFLQLLDELGLKRENGRTLFDNKEKWVYAKSDRKIFCVKTGIFWVAGLFVGPNAHEYFRGTSMYKFVGPITNNTIC